MNKRILTGITTTGIPHIGNYLGAIKPALNLSKEYDESFFFLADYHAIIKNTYSEDISKSVESVAPLLSRQLLMIIESSILS